MSRLRHGSDGHVDCDVQESGAIELYFYDELDPGERDRIGTHVRQCRGCASILEDLRMIRQALAARPDVAAPDGGDWSGFMGRLESAVRQSGVVMPAQPSPNVATFRARSSRHSYAGLFAMAALLALVTIGVAFVARERSAMRSWHDSTASTEPASSPMVPVATTGLRSAGAKHFERSKLVVLGLAARESQEATPADWAYERQLATSLLNDTRLYRMAAEERGLTGLAGIMRDLEIVLLETSMAQETDAAALEQIQRLIRKRGLIQKMDTVASAGM